MAFLSATLVDNQQTTLKGLCGGQLKAGSGIVLRPVHAGAYALRPYILWRNPAPTQRLSGYARYASAPFTGCTIIGELNQISVN